MQGTDWKSLSYQLFVFTHGPNSERTPVCRFPFIYITWHGVSRRIKQAFCALAWCHINYSILHALLINSTDLHLIPSHLQPIPCHLYQLFTHPVVLSTAHPGPAGGSGQVVCDQVRSGRVRWDGLVTVYWSRSDTTQPGSRQSGTGTCPSLLPPAKPPTMGVRRLRLPASMPAHIYTHARHIGIDGHAYVNIYVHTIYILYRVNIVQGSTRTRIHTQYFIIV